jgi:hypothetical protein
MWANKANNFKIIIPEGIGNCAEQSEAVRHLKQNVSPAERGVEPVDLPTKVGRMKQSG